MSNEIKVVKASEETVLSYSRKVTVEYDGETYDGWVYWDDAIERYSVEWIGNLVPEFLWNLSQSDIFNLDEAGREASANGTLVAVEVEL